MEFLTHRAAGASKASVITNPVRGHGRAAARPVLLWLGISLQLFVLLIASEVPARAQGKGVEYQVKAAFLLNFTKFVEWPGTGFASPDAPVTICVVGEDPFGDILDRTIEGETANGHAIRAQRIPPDGDLQSCHVLFISRSEKGRFPQIVSRLDGSSTLTVSELPGFSQAGGMIEFIVEEGKARFFINAATTEAAGLKLSSRLLRVAKQSKGS